MSLVGLHRLTDAELERLLGTLAKLAHGDKLNRMTLELSRFGHLEQHLSVLVGQQKSVAITIVSAVLLERRSHGASGSTLLWAGPPPTGRGAREPYEVIRDCIATAERTFFWAGVDLQRDARLLSSLHAAQRGRELTVTLVLERAGAAIEEAAYELFLERLPQPTLYAAAASDGLVSPLPQCIVVDETDVLVCAGGPVTVEPDDRAVTLGVQVHEPALARALLANWYDLIDAGKLSIVQSRSNRAT